MTTASSPCRAEELRRVEFHMGTSVTLGGSDVSRGAADACFARIAELEQMLSRFRSDSDLSKLDRGELTIDDVDPSVREVLATCEHFRELTGGDFEHEVRSPDASKQTRLDPDAVAKGWIIEEAALILKLSGAGDFFLCAGGDVVTARCESLRPWRVGIQHPGLCDAVIGTVESHRAAIATSVTYERGGHIRGSVDLAASCLQQVTVIGPNLATADALATAVFASGRVRPSWWAEVEHSYGLVTIDGRGGLRSIAPGNGTARFTPDVPVQIQ